MEKVDYYVYEDVVARLERCKMRMAIIAGLLFAAVIGTNLLWFMLT